MGGIELCPLHLFFIRCCLMILLSQNSGIHTLMLFSIQCRIKLQGIWSAGEIEDGTPSPKQFIARILGAREQTNEYSTSFRPSFMTKNRELSQLQGLLSNQPHSSSQTSNSVLPKTKSRIRHDAWKACESQLQILTPASDIYLFTREAARHASWL
jgi:hypothetical protein